MSPHLTQDRKNTSYYSSTYRRDYQNHWSSCDSEHKPENSITSINSCSGDTGVVFKHSSCSGDSADTRNVTEDKVDEASEVAVDMVNQDKKEIKDTATQTDFDLTVVVCAWEKTYDPKNKKEYVCAPLQFEQSSTMNEKGIQ